MFGFKKKKGADASAVAPSEKQALDNPSKDSASVFSRLKQGLSKTRHQLTDGIIDAIAGKKTLDKATLETLETVLLTADVGVEASDAILASVTEKASRRELADEAALRQLLKHALTECLAPCDQGSITLSHQPTVILMVGVNGAGKTTSIGKLAHHFKSAGRSVMLAAGDTFRAAAVNQLVAWGERNEVPVVSQADGADSASVIYDAYVSAKAKGIDVLIADTAGRLHTQDNLMDELKKINRVLTKIDPTAPHEVLLVLDATIGQNALNQAKAFHQAIGVSGLLVTKLDGTAKGGIVFAIAKQLALPIRYIGVGEQRQDLRAFAATPFIEALFE